MREKVLFYSNIIMFKTKLNECEQNSIYYIMYECVLNKKYI